MPHRKIKSYSEMIALKTFKERLHYLRITDGHQSPRDLSNGFYKSKLWRQTRKKIIERDLGYDLASSDVGINGTIIVHHINPIEEKDLIEGSYLLTDPDNLICTSVGTHNFIHYGGHEVEELKERTPNDTKLW